MSIASNVTVGMFGGKFAPFHLGHHHCLKRASDECDIVHLILFIDLPACKDRDDVWGFRNRIGGVIRASSEFHNVLPHWIDTSDCKGWDDETPLVRYIAPKIDRVYSSEPDYGDYFSRAYPEAVHVVVDPDRKAYPISGTAIREMMKNGDEEWKKWTI